MNNLQPVGELTIGALARQTGFNVSAIRYYEEIGLIPPALRRPSGHRVYNPQAQELLKLIRHCREFGFSIDETRELTSLAANDGKDCGEARAIAQQHLDAVRAKLAEMRALEISLAGFVQACSDHCIGGPAPQCTILKDLHSGGPAACCG